MDHDIIGKATQVKLELVVKCFVGIFHIFTFGGEWKS